MAWFKMINEAFLKEDTQDIITGEYVASLLGMEKEYQQGKQQEMQDIQMGESIKKSFASLTERLNKVGK